MNINKDNALRDRLADEDSLGAFIDANLDVVFVAKMHFKRGWDAAEANLLSTHPVVLKMVAALKIYSTWYVRNYLFNGEDAAKEALEAYRESIK